MTARGKRLLMFSPGHAEQGGAARRSRLIAATFAERGWTVRVVTRAGTLNRLRLTRSPNLVVVEVPGFDSPRFGALLFGAVGLVLGTFWGARATCILAIQLVSPTSVASACSLLVHRPFICMATASGTLGELHYATRTRLAGVRLWLLRRATYIVAQNADQASDLQAVARSDAVITLPNPVQLPASAPLTGEPKVLFTGRFSVEKDLMGLLDCWSGMVHAGRIARLTLVGDGGSYRSVDASLKERVASDRELQQTVSFTGWVPDVSFYLLGHDVFVFPSLTEGMSNALLEAAAYGRVVVASDIPGNRAVLGDDYPLYFPPGDQGALRVALEAALDDEEVRLRARAVLQARTASFAPDVVVQRLESLIEDATHRSRDQR